MINRRLNKLITSILNTRKAIIIIGARQVGKSTLLKEIFGNSSDVI
jgi:predicted AAA+ superfamily ATPase